MLKIYTSLTSFSCKKAKNWFNEHRIKYKEFNLHFYQIKMQDIDFILQHTKNGFDSIISKRSNIYKNKKINFDKISCLGLKKIIIQHPNILRTPIIIDNNKLIVGYNSEDIRIFLPKSMRSYFISKKIYKNHIEYKQLLDNYFSQKNK